jgi:hypothetical protein
MRPRHHVWGVLLGPLATYRSISMGSGTIVEFCSEPISVRADVNSGPKAENLLGTVHLA